MDLSLISLLEQEKASKEKAAKDKALQEAIRSHQRQEELNGFWKICVRMPPHAENNISPHFV